MHLLFMSFNVCFEWGAAKKLLFKRKTWEDETREMSVNYL